MLSNHTFRWLRTIGQRGIPGAVAILLAIWPAAVANAASGTDFNVQVSPSPLAVTLTPGHSQSASLTVRNFSSHSETLHPALQGFTIDSKSQKISLNDNVPADMADWVHFKQASLTIAPGTGVPLDITFDTPTDVGFSYSLAITLSRNDTPRQLGQAGAQLQPRIAVFCLANINRPNAKSQLSLSSVASDKSHYNFLPATFTITVANSGNIITQPSGTLFIQRSYDSPTPVASLPINPGHGYVLPGTSRKFIASWASGFPVYITKTANGRPSVHLTWNWKHVSEFRVGKYIAKAVVVYNDGHEDIPVVGSATFWVIPWWLLICSLLVVVILAMGLIGWGWVIFKGTKKVQKYAHPHKK